jgi:hypothetical protein
MARPLRPVTRPPVLRIVSRRPRILVDISEPPEWERQVREGVTATVRFYGVVDSLLEEAVELSCDARTPSGPYGVRHAASESSLFLWCSGDVTSERIQSSRAG